MAKERYKVINVAIPGGTAPGVYNVPLQLADRVSAYVEGWLSNGFTGNVHLFEGNLQLAEAIGRLGLGPCDALMTVSDGAVTRVPVSEDARSLTIYVDTLAPGAGVQMVSLKVCERVPTEALRTKGL